MNAETEARRAGGPGDRRLTLNVLDSEVLYLLWVIQDGFTQDVDGTQVSELPVSKQPVNCFGGFPSWKTPKYCTHKRLQVNGYQEKKLTKGKSLLKASHRLTKPQVGG